MSFFYPYSFSAQIEHHDVGSDRYRYTVIFVPAELKVELPLDIYPRLRVTGEVDDHPIEAAFNPVRGAHYILLSKKLLGAIGKGLGDVVDVRFRLADQDAVDCPARLQAALGAEPEMLAMWQATTPGKQRALAHMVASAKQSETQDRRIAQVFAVLRGAIDLKGNPLL